MAPALLGILMLAALLNVFVSLRVLRSHYYSPGQKLAQCLIVWLIPVLGPVCVFVFLRTQVGWEKYDTRAYPEPSEKMVVVEINDAIHENLGGSADAIGD